MTRLFIRVLCCCTFILCVPLTHANEADAEKWSVEKAHAAVKAAIPQAEADPTRPVFHFRPPAQWMNDICGAIYYNGYYHIFYQYNPFSGDRWGDDYTLWAHARSKDLVHWEDLPWAFTPMKEKGEIRCNSGSVALDDNGKPMAFYTFVPAYPEATRFGKREQWGAKPLDEDLIKWERVPNPLMAPGLNGVPEDVNAGWSDPFVFRADGRTFVTYKSCNGLVGEATNPELTEWKYAGKMDGVDGECPNFFPLQDKWVLLRSTKPPTYVVGDFDAENIAFHMNGPEGVLDHGFGANPPEDRAWTRGLYATNTFFDKDGRCIMVGWVCGFKPNRGWNGCMSLPRVLSLDKNNNLVQTPAPELEALRGDHFQLEDLVVKDETRVLPVVQGDTLELAVTITPKDGAAFGLKTRCSESGERGVTIGYSDGALNVGGTEVPVSLPDNNGTLSLRIFIDKSVMEVFVNNGPTSVTRVDYPEEDDLSLAIFAEGSVVVNTMDIWELKSIW